MGVMTKLDLLAIERIQEEKKGIWYDRCRGIKSSIDNTITFHVTSQDQICGIQCQTDQSVVSVHDYDTLDLWLIEASTSFSGQLAVLFSLLCTGRRW